MFRAGTLRTLRNGEVITANADLNLPLFIRAPVTPDLHWARSLDDIHIDAEATVRRHPTSTLGLALAKPSVRLGV